MPNEHLDQGLTFVGREAGLDVYRSRLTEKDVFIGRIGLKGDATK